MKNFPEDWKDLKYRPLCSYVRHHWRKVHSLAGKYCSFIVEFLGIGLGVSNPAKFVADANRFNQMRTEMQALITEFYDLENFFPNVGLDDLKDALQFVEKRLRWKFPRLVWF